MKPTGPTRQLPSLSLGCVRVLLQRRDPTLGAPEPAWGSLQTSLGLFPDGVPSGRLLWRGKLGDRSALSQPEGQKGRPGAHNILLLLLSLLF